MGEPQNTHTHPPHNCVCYSVVWYKGSEREKAARARACVRGGDREGNRRTGFKLLEEEEGGIGKGGGHIKLGSDVR